jgi:hypothetical protein
MLALISDKNPAISGKFVSDAPSAVATFSAALTSATLPIAAKTLDLTAPKM